MAGQTSGAFPQLQTKGKTMTTGAYGRKGGNSKGGRKGGGSGKKVGC